MLDNLVKYQNRLLKTFNIKYKRYIFNDINFDDKMIAIFGQEVLERLRHYFSIY